MSKIPLAASKSKYIVGTGELGLHDQLQPISIFGKIGCLAK